MNILVAISKVPDTTTKISLKDNKINEEGIQWIINPYDEWYALVKAIEIKEKDATTKVTVLTVGDATADAVLRKAMAYGADDAVRIDTTPKDSFFVASQIVAYVQTENYDLILTGKESIDYNQGATGGIVAGILHYPYAALATSLEITESKAIVKNDVDNGNEIIELSLPAVVSCAKGMATQRIPNMRGIMAARTKPLKIIPAYEQDIFTEVVYYELPEPKGEMKLFNNVEDFIATLKTNKLI